MKTKITLFLAAVILLTGCDLFKNAAEITINTNLTADIPVIVAPETVSYTHLTLPTIYSV